jgi:hypothetical protein
MTRSGAIGSIAAKIGAPPPRRWGKDSVRPAECDPARSAGVTSTGRAIGESTAGKIRSSDYALQCGIHSRCAQIAFCEMVSSSGCCHALVCGACAAG